MSEIPPTGWKLAPARPSDNERTEQCPECLAWMKPKKDGMIRKHKPDGKALTCLGWNVEDTRRFMVRTLPVPGSKTCECRFMVTGRRSAEVIASKQRVDATVAVVQILEPIS